MHTTAYPTDEATCCTDPQVWTNTTNSVIREGQLDDGAVYMHACSVSERATQCVQVRCFVC